MIQTLSLLKRLWILSAWISIQRLLEWTISILRLRHEVWLLSCSWLDWEIFSRLNLIWFIVKWRLISWRVTIIGKVTSRPLLHECLVHNFINDVLNFLKFYCDVFNIPSDDCVFLLKYFLWIFWRFEVLSKGIRQDGLVKSNIQSFKILK